MQNYTNYIIGLLVLVVVGFLIYSLNLPEKDSYENKTDASMVDGDHLKTLATNTEVNNLATNTEIQNQINKKENISMKETQTVRMETNKGTIVLELNSKIAPKTVENFVKLSQAGFYNGVKFHRVIKDFMIQAGDPQSKDDKLVNAWGTGGPGYQFADEITDPATYKTGYKRGVLAMANSGPNTNGSQFFIMHKDVPLPPNYTIFGKVISGLETVDAIANTQTGANDRPVTAVVITKISVE